MLKSMTAFARVEKAEADLSADIEIRSYNSRGLDIALRLPAGYAGLEEKIKTMITASIVRGRVEARVRIRDLGEAPGAYMVDAGKARAYLTAVEQLKGILNQPVDLSLEHLAAVPGIIQAVEDTGAVARSWPIVEQCLQQALSELDRMRRNEGDFLSCDFTQRLKYISEAIDNIEKTNIDLVTIYRDRLLSRIETLTRDTIAPDPARIAQEAAILADRSDISEEIVRARSHVRQFSNIMQSEEAGGRKLNFLLQEFNREFNTMGSKIGQADVAHLIIDIKAEIEKMREQVQNIE